MATKKGPIVIVDYNRLFFTNCVTLRNSINLKKLKFRLDLDFFGKMKLDFRLDFKFFEFEKKTFDSIEKIKKTRDSDFLKNVTFL